MNQAERLAVGLMSGTSIDGLDVVLVRQMESQLGISAARTFAIPGSLTQSLRDLASRSAISFESIYRTDGEFTSFCADSVRQFLAHERIDHDRIEAIGSHGQTVRHYPGGPHPFTVQLGDPNQLAEQTGITVVADFRRRDVAAGGQGAPLTPSFHAATFRASDAFRAVLNLGGIANVTLLPQQGPVAGFDTGPANTLLDAWSQRHLGSAMDFGGAWARSGTVLSPLLERLLADPYFDLLAPKSTGPEYFNLNWLPATTTAYPEADVQRTLVELTVRSIIDSITGYGVQELLVCGGGRHNDFLMERLTETAAVHAIGVRTTDSVGVNGDWVEGAAFAWMALRTLDRQPSSLSTVTGARGDRVLGGIYYA